MMLKEEAENLTFTTANRIGTSNAVYGQISTLRQSSAKLEWTEKQVHAAGRRPS